MPFGKNSKKSYYLWDGAYGIFAKDLLLKQAKVFIKNSHELLSEYLASELKYPSIKMKQILT